MCQDWIQSKHFAQNICICLAAVLFGPCSQHCRLCRLTTPTLPLGWRLVLSKFKTVSFHSSLHDFVWNRISERFLYTELTMMNVPLELPANSPFITNASLSRLKLFNSWSILSFFIVSSLLTLLITLAAVKTVCFTKPGSRWATNSSLHVSFPVLRIQNKIHAI